MHTIAIIGAGFSGSLVAVHLLRQGAGLPVRVILIDRAGVFGPGLAYGNGSESLLLNVVAGRMSALPDEASDFLRWAKRIDPSVRGETFLPRRMYGMYVGELLERSARECGSGSELHRVADEVIDVRTERDGVVVACRRGGEIKTDAVVLALGNAAPARGGWCSAALEGSGRYIGDPWRGEALSRVGEDERVLIVGTGLTMMDVALSLAEAGHRGTIEAVSRRGLLPQAHRHGNPGLAKLPDPLFSRTYSTVRELVRAVRAEAKRAEARGGDWRDVVNALRSITPSLWGALDERERRRFMDHVLPFWNTHRHRSPPSVGEGIERLRAAGQLRVHAARIRSVAPGREGVEVELLPRGAEDAAGRVRTTVDRIINCTGPDADLRKAGDALAARLLASGVARPGPLGMGLDCDDEGRVVGEAGRKEERLYLIGPTRVGQLWETTAVPELRVQAAVMARRLLEGPGRGAFPSGGVRVDVSSGARTGPAARG